jgi:hypothetical protein
LGGKQQREVGAALGAASPTNGQAKRGGLAALAVALLEATATRLVMFTSAEMTIVFNYVKYSTNSAPLAKLPAKHGINAKSTVDFDRTSLRADFAQPRSGGFDSTKTG